MDENSRKEEFSYGYIHTLASVCGYVMHRAERQLDNRGIDLEIISSELENGDAARIAIQSKCTTKKYFHDCNTCFKYDLKVNNYKKLIKKSIDPTFLIFVIVPEEIQNWLYVDLLLDIDKKTILKDCAYWVSLQGQPQVTNRTKVRIEIPKEQVLTKEALNKIMLKATEDRKRLIDI